MSGLDDNKRQALRRLPKTRFYKSDEDLLLKAKLVGAGLKFKCFVCEKTHSMKTSGWAHCCYSFLEEVWGCKNSYAVEDTVLLKHTHAFHYNETAPGESYITVGICANLGRRPCFSGQYIVVKGSEDGYKAELRFTPAILGMKNPKYYIRKKIVPELLRLRVQVNAQRQTRYFDKTFLEKIDHSIETHIKSILSNFKQTSLSFDALKEVLSLLKKTVSNLVKEKCEGLLAYETDDYYGFESLLDKYNFKYTQPELDDEVKRITDKILKEIK